MSLPVTDHAQRQAARDARERHRDDLDWLRRALATREADPRIRRTFTLVLTPSFDA
jgi:hypothetical protein